MGAILNGLPLNTTENLGKISPNRADWLTSHADATGLAVVEVERLWNRFRQLTNSNDQTQLQVEGSGLSNELSNDIFVKNFMRQYPRSKTNANNIPFGYFILVMQFFDGASTEKKLAALFLYLNNGEPITGVGISRLLKFVYPETTDNEIKALSVQFMRQLGSTEQGQLNQQQFVTGVQRFIPPDELEELLSFDIIPPYVLKEVNRLPSLPGSATNLHNSNDYGNNELLNDNQLRQIATRTAQKNWSRLAITLGFLEYDIESYKVQNNQDSTATIYELLRTWREQEGLLATKARLKHCLRQSGFDELLPILH